jgi:RNA polymerase sigma factor (sigma-70 family)
MTPETSTTLLRDIASSAENARWGEFCARYEPMMRGYLREHFPYVEADDVVQETLVALAGALPDYHYNPQEHGYFHNYLTGILRNKAVDAVRAGKRVEMLKDGVAKERFDPDKVTQEADYRCWREAIFEIALQQFLADDAIQDRTKQMFVRTEIGGEPIGAVAESLGVSAQLVYRARSRCLKNLSARIEALKSV